MVITTFSSALFVSISNVNLIFITDQLTAGAGSGTIGGTGGTNPGFVTLDPNQGTVTGSAGMIVISSDSFSSPMPHFSFLHHLIYIVYLFLLSLFSPFIYVK